MSKEEMPRRTSNETRSPSLSRSRIEAEVELLARWNAGDPEALENLISSRYGDLVRTAGYLLRREVAPPCEPEELVTELYLHLRAVRKPSFTDHSSFFRFGFRVMHQILIDRARARLTVRRGGDLKRVDLSEDIAIDQPAFVDVLHFEAALEKLDPNLVSVVELRFFQGLTMTEVAKVSGWSRDKVARYWAAAKLQLRNLLLVPTLRGGAAGVSEGASIDIVKPIITLDLVSSELIRTLSLHPELMKTLDWRAFEYLLATILEKLEYEVELQRGTKDGGIDIFAIKRDGPFGLNRYLLQAKRWSKAVDVQPVREILFLHHEHRVTKSCLATTSRFTRGAWQIADEYRWILELRDYEGLQEWLHLSGGQKAVAPGLGNEAAGRHRR